MEKNNVFNLEKDEQAETLARQIQQYLARGNSIKRIPSGVSGEGKRINPYRNRRPFTST